MQLSSYLNGPHLVDLHELNMKSDEVIELLEHFDMDVIYDFDRIHEGTADHYSSLATAEGFELRFDEHQVLETIWCYIRQRGKFLPIDPAAIVVFIPDTVEDANRHATGDGARVSDTSPGPDAQAWLRVESDTLWVHYEFSGGALALVTLMRPWE